MLFLSAVNSVSIQVVLMATPIIKLSDAIINYASGRRSSSKPEWSYLKGALENKGDRIRDLDVDGFDVVRSGVNTLSFRLYYRLHGKRGTLTIGQFPKITTTQARELAKAKALEVANGENPVQKKQAKTEAQSNTLDSYLKHEYALHMDRAIAGKDYLAVIRNHFPRLLKKPLSDISKTDLVKWLQEQMGEYKDGKRGYSSDSIKKRYSALKSLMSHAVRNNVIPLNPFDKMDKLEFHRDEGTQQQARRTYLEIDQIKALMQSIDNYDKKLRAERRNSRSHGQAHLPDLDNLAFASHHKPMLLVLFYMGMRIGDVTSLQWEHVIDTPFTCNITKVLEKTRRKVKEPFVLPMPEQVRDALKLWRIQQGKPNSGLVFPNPKSGKRMDKKCLQRCWKWVKQDAEFHDDLQLYALRHNFVSWLIMKNTPLKVVAEMAGHKTTTMIDKHYGHLIKGATKQASDTFASLLNTNDNRKVVEIS